MVIKSLEEMGSDGRTKMTEKASTMNENYDAAKFDMKKNFGLQPFGPLRIKHYNERIDAAKHKVDADRWKERWTEAMKK